MARNKKQIKMKALQVYVYPDEESALKRMAQEDGIDEMSPFLRKQIKKILPLYVVKHHTGSSPL